QSSKQKKLSKNNDYSDTAIPANGTIAISVKCLILSRNFCLEAAAPVPFRARVIGGQPYAVQ
ncbi:hypothetical protein LB565_29690, partial [Mesorhizobium sp. CA14]|uniref:hypothetical protein n=1 Tax=Mesorhizobium sp. CA14 TaxID=2876642 RepID=UPI001CCAE3D4